MPNPRKGKNLWNVWLYPQEEKDMKKAIKDKNEKLLLAIFEELNKRNDLEKR